MTDQYAQFKGLEVRRPGDVPAATPLSWQFEKFTEHNDRLANNAIPADFPHDVQRGDAGDALAAIALRESIRQHVERERGIRVHEAIQLGATWEQVAAALDVDPKDARTLLRDWAESQHRLHRRDVERGEARPFGLDDEQYAAVLALCELGDEETVAGER
ncbi:hypothetical protein [Streptomyces spiralis]|uniref:hypothetical protein n=1 Tax=Streptomyces spiralis TaxID=66376 RepID=UPI0036AEBD23